MELILIVLVTAIGLGAAVAILGRAAYHTISGDRAAEPNDDEPVVLEEFSTEMDAQIARGCKLEALGIGAYARNTQSLGMYLPQIYGQWQVLVRYGDLDAAREVLAAPVSYADS